MGMGIRGGGAARQVRALFELGATGSLEDRELLGRFLGRDESAELAFAALVDRHGRMVLRVCRDVLGDAHAAQDAAQATFFILARQAAAIRKPEALPSWLQGTARRVATRALRESIRRRKHERRVAEIAVQRPADDKPDGCPELHEELAKLPDRYRDPIVLCDLAGLTHEQAAGKLGCPPRTLETRLYRGRERLKDRLIRRGVAPSTAAVGVASASETQAAMPSAWVASTASAATRLASRSGWTLAGDVPVDAVRWARNHLRETAMIKLKLILGSGLLLGLALQRVQSQTPPPSVAPKAETKVRQATPRTDSDPSLPKTYTHPITVTGRAFDPDGKPIAGARIYLASLRADYKRLAEARTDAEGRYEFRDVPLPIERKDPTAIVSRDVGAFQIFGEAEGFGFAFRPLKWFYPAPKPSNITYEPERTDPPQRYEATDPIVLELRFARAARLAGTIRDDLGNPLGDVKVEIRGCETGVLLNDSPNWSFETLNQPDDAPASMKIRTTDALGRFAFEGMPADCRFRIDVRAKGFPSRWVLAATAAQSPRFYLGSPVETGDLKITMAIPIEIPVRMIFADTGKPAAKVAVQASGMDLGVLQTSNDQGLASLKLPKGTYRMSNWPARGMPYLVTEGELVVGEVPPAEPLVYTLRPAAILEVTVVDEATGQGLGGLDLWHGGPEHEKREKLLMPSWQEATRTAWQDSPRSDNQGKLRAFVEPGRTLFGVGKETALPWYVPSERDGQEVNVRAGETTSVTFRMRNVKKGK